MILLFTSLCIKILNSAPTPNYTFYYNIISCIGHIFWCLADPYIFNVISKL